MKQKEMKKWMLVALCAVMLFSFAACGESKDAGKSSTGTDISADAQENLLIGGDDSVQIPNPFIDCATLEEAGKLVGFDITVPENMDGYEDKMIQAVAQEDMKMIQIMFRNEKENQVCFRKAAGSEDISGDYNVYKEQKEVTVGDKTVLLKGSSESVRNASWTSGEYTYSIYTDTDDFDEAAMTELVKALQ